MKFGFHVILPSFNVYKVTVSLQPLSPCIAKKAEKSSSSLHSVYLFAQLPFGLGTLTFISVCSFK